MSKKYLKVLVLSSFFIISIAHAFTTILPANTGPNWNITDNTIITGDVINFTNINFLPPVGGVFKTLAIDGGSFSGGGNIKMNTFLGNDFSPTDLLIISGGSAVTTSKHPFKIQINNAGGKGAPTLGNGILLVDAVNGGTTGENTFIADPLSAGPFLYTLNRGSLDASGPDNWYLRSTTLIRPGEQSSIFPSSAVLGTVVIPVVNSSGVIIPTAFLVVPHYRVETSLFSALPSMELLYGRFLMDSLHRRVGEEAQLCCKDDPLNSYAFVNGFWVRLVNQGGRIEDGNIFHDGPNFNFHITAFQFGVDFYRQEHPDGSRDLAGLLGGVGNNNGDIEHFDGSNAGTDSFDGYTFGAYWTHLGCNDWYLEGNMQANYYMVQTTSVFENQIKPNGLGLGASLESGYPFKPFNSWDHFVIEPQAQIAYQTLKIDDTQDGAATVLFDRPQSVSGRIGLRFADTWLWLPSRYSHPNKSSKVTGWIRASAWHEFDSDSVTSFSSQKGWVSFPSTLSGTWLQGDLGFTIQLTSNVFFHFSGGGEFYLNDNRGRTYNVAAGGRLNI